MFCYCNYIRYYYLNYCFRHPQLLFKLLHPTCIITYIVISEKYYCCLNYYIRHPQLLFESLSEFISLLEHILLLKAFPFMHGLLLFRIIQQINLKINAVINAINAYAIAKTKKLSSNAANVTIKKIAKNVADTNNGLFIIFCKTIASIIVATGNAKNINKVFILALLSYRFLYIICFVNDYGDR